ncbi:coatomer subunit alpha [Entophlyctis sp. JEL0112]|nr:coatomer subunit alpha [Entophlyctis sp. JEL0112]
MSTPSKRLRGDGDDVTAAAAARSLPVTDSRERVESATTAGAANSSSGVSFEEPVPKTTDATHPLSQSLSVRNLVAAFSNATYSSNPSSSSSRSPSSSQPVTKSPAKYSQANCPICLDPVKNAFVTKCRHSFCYECIAAHLSIKKSCPTCYSALADQEIYPNFGLSNRAYSNAGTERDLVSSDFELIPDLADDSNSSLKEIDSMLMALIEKRKKIESNEKDVQLVLLNEFLRKVKKEKLDELESLQESIACLNEDLSLIHKELEKTRRAPKAEKLASSTFDFQNVPSTPVVVTTNQKSNPPSAAAVSNSVCSSPLPPSLPAITTPTNTWSLYNNIAQTTGSALDVFKSRITLSGPRKRTHEEINESDDHPPFEFTSINTTGVAPTTADKHDADSVQAVVKTRMARIEPHFFDLQHNYFNLRLRNRKQFSASAGLASISLNSLSPPTATGANRGRDQASFDSRTVSPSTRLNESAQFSACSADSRPFSETLSRFSKFSSLRTLARINYADKLVSGSGVSSNPSVGANAAAAGNSSIVSAIEFDAEDRLFATAGVTRKIKIYEYESVVRDWGEVFGDGSASIEVNRNRRRLRRELGPSLFVADALRGEGTGDNDSDTDEERNDFNSGIFGDGNRTEDIPRYPILEMNARSKISWLSWNSYIKHYLSSSDYEGVVTLWDSNTGVSILEYEEHEKRTWSVDFNSVDPVLLASGSDDCKVKIWSTNQKKSVQTIESKANICSVKWNPCVSNQIAFGSADHHIHYYDIRKSSEPLYILQGHKKAVSYVKFLSRNEIVSASTDSTLRLWNLGSTSASSVASGPSSPTVSSLFPPLSSFIESNLTQNLASAIFRRSASSILNLQRTPTKLNPSACSSPMENQKPYCVRSFAGHVNEKNFVGMSINSTGEFIACGSENNCVYTYFSSLSNPIVSHRFGNAISTDNGEEVQDSDPSHFISNVCWMRKSPDILIAANSVGGVKVLQLV